MPAESSSFLTYALLTIAGLLVGAVFSWLWTRTRAAAAHAAAGELRRQNDDLTGQLQQTRTQLDRELQHRIEAQTHLKQQEQNLAEQRRLLQEAEKKLADTFKAVASTALQENRSTFLDSAKQTLQAVLAEAKGDLGQRKQAIDAVVKPLSETLQRYQQQLQQIERTRQEAYGQLRQQLIQVGSTQEALQRETGNLVTALRNPQVRGRWGELTLRRTAELAGMSKHCDFAEQVSVVTDEQVRLRPDMIVRLPSDRQVVIDSKVPLAAYLEAVAAGNEEQRQTALANHARQVADHIDRLAAKSYWNQFSDAPEFVVLFLPGECFFSAALECQPGLIEYGIQRRVILATPTTLIALLHSVAYGWQQEQITRNARQIAEIGKELHDRIRTFANHFKDARTGLARTVTAFDSAIGSLESRVLTSVRRFKDLGVSTTDHIPTIDPIRRTPRDLQLSDPDPSADSADGPDQPAPPPAD